MAAGSWRESLELVTRPEDWERLGYLQKLGSGRWEPLNLLGIPLGEAMSRDDAIELVRAEGLASISRPWWIRAPMPMVESRLDARSVDASVDWRRMVVVELTPDRALLRSEIPWPEESGRLVSVTLPATDVLYADYPDEE
jgi:hypothetical protein